MYSVMHFCTLIRAVLPWVGGRPLWRSWQTRWTDVTAPGQRPHRWWDHWTARSSAPPPAPAPHQTRVGWRPSPNRRQPCSIRRLERARGPQAQPRGAHRESGRRARARSGDAAGRRRKRARAAPSRTWAPHASTPGARRIALPPGSARSPWTPRQRSQCARQRWRRRRVAYCSVFAGLSMSSARREHPQRTPPGDRTHRSPPAGRTAPPHMQSTARVNWA